MSKDDEFRVYREGKHPKPKRHFFPGTFPSRRKARMFCKNRWYEDGLVIVHPDGKEEPYTY